MKIMFAVGSYWPSQDGVATITEYLAEGLAHRGHDVYVLTSAGDGGRQELPYDENHEGVYIERMRIYVEWPLHLRGRDAESTQKRYIKSIREYNPDVLVVVCAQTWPLDWVIPYLDEIKCKKIFYSHGFSSMREKYNIATELKHRNVIGAYREWKIKNYYRNLYKHLAKFDTVIQLSEINNSYTYCEEHGIPSMVITNAVQDRFVDEDILHIDCEEGMWKADIASADNTSTDVTEASLTFLYVANYNPNKNQEMLLRAYYKAAIPGSKLVFTGFEENDYLRKLYQINDELKKQVIEKAGDDGSGALLFSPNVVFNIHLSREEIYNLYRDADVFVSTSLSENSPIVHREAATCGMPVISLDVGDVRTMDGVLIVSDEQELAETMKQLSENHALLYSHGNRIHEYMMHTGCTVTDKINQFERILSPRDGNSRV